MSKSGYFSGYGAYRYGAQAAPVTLAGPKPKPALGKGKRQHVVNAVIDMMRDWRASPFEKEASIWHGLRSGLCLKGCGWSRADAEAASVVAEALRARDAKRPSWAEGQPDYVEPRDTCAWCGGATPDDSHYGLKARRYCSDLCAKAAFEHKAFERRSAEDRDYQAAYRIVARARNPSRACLLCGASFQPVRANGEQRFCSVRCGRKHGAEVRGARVFSITCEVCGEWFASSISTARQCSKRCTSIKAKFRRGEPPARISPPVFDYVFEMAA